MLNSYVNQVKDVEQMESRLKKEKIQNDQRQKQLDERQAKMRTEEDFLRKQRLDWDAQSKHRTNELEDAIQAKRDLIAQLEKASAVKAAEMAKKLGDFEQTKAGEERKLKD